MKKTKLIILRCDKHTMGKTGDFGIIEFLDDKTLQQHIDEMANGLEEGDLIVIPKGIFKIKIHKRVTIIEDK